MLPCNCIGCILGRALRTKETHARFSFNLGSRKKKKGLNGVVSGYPTSTNLPRVDGLSMDPRDLRRHKGIKVIYTYFFLFKTFNN